MKVYQQQINEHIKRDILACSLEEFRGIIKDIIKLLQDNKIESQKNSFTSCILLKENFYYAKEILSEECKLNENISLFSFNSSEFINEFNICSIKKLQKIFESSKALSTVFIEIDDIDKLDIFTQKILSRKIKKINNNIIFIATLSSQKKMKKFLLQNTYFDKIIKVYQDDKENTGIIEYINKKYDFKFSNNFPMCSLISIFEDLREKDWLYILFHAMEISRKKNCDGVIFIEHFKEAIKRYSKYYKGPEKFDLNNI
ncbi:AAA family ATPase [Clostridioides difficile]|uniref:AAA family ATPase n=1 Tax=Clostridioides difficile TaxID=1496 RepID=UPI000D1DC1FE|nr:AAA family ATPase [Clostridioides difficile]HBE9444569.1 AAA family ATPase [Clostridioides difficile]